MSINNSTYSLKEQNICSDIFIRRDLMHIFKHCGLPGTFSHNFIVKTEYSIPGLKPVCQISDSVCQSSSYLNLQDGYFTYEALQASAFILVSQRWFFFMIWKAQCNTGPLPNGCLQGQEWQTSISWLGRSSVPPHWSVRHFPYVGLTQFCLVCLNR